MGGNLYNFGFGDLDSITNDINVIITSNNGDVDLIMGTLGRIIYEFTEIFEGAIIYIEGTTAARTRIYQLHINKHWKRINPVFEVSGLINNQWEPFSLRLKFFPSYYR